jgi:C4-dicarboxylate-binding protein DctP
MGKLEPKGIKGLAFWDNGFHMVSANKPLLMPDDVKGLKVRISGSKIADLYFRRLGALPQIMAFSEVYQALQTGVVDGCENTPSNYYTQKFHEVQKHITNTKHGHLQYAVIVNAKNWAALPADIRSGLDKAIAEATDYTNMIAQQENADALKAIRESGKSTVHELNDAQRKAWIAALMPTYKAAEGRVGKEVLALIEKTVGVKAM